MIQPVACHARFEAERKAHSLRTDLGNRNVKIIFALDRFDI